MGYGVNVSACLVTKGDVDMQPVLDSLSPEWEVIVWDNGARDVTINGRSVTTHDGDDPEFSGKRFAQVAELSVYGRYAAIEYASHDLIYVQDDDVIVSDPQAIVNAALWHDRCFACDEDNPYEICTCGDPFRFDGVVCNMPQKFRQHYDDAALVGFGACFHRDAPRRAFERLFPDMVNPDPLDPEWTNFRKTLPDGTVVTMDNNQMFLRECDRVFTVLTPRVLVDVPKVDREFASADDRLWRQPDHAASTARMLDLARQVRDAR
jgi:hypothetical protein